MAKLQRAWAEYRAALYPDGLTAEQSQQLHRAFFAGTLVMLTETQSLSELPDDQAVAGLTDLSNECLSVNAGRLKP